MTSEYAQSIHNVAITSHDFMQHPYSWTQRSWTQTLKDQPKVVVTEARSTNDDKVELDEICTKFVEFVKADYHCHWLTIEFIARKLEICKKQLERKLKNNLEVTPKQYIKNYRLSIAEQALRSGARPSTLAVECGFSSHAYFTRCFREEFGVTPSVWQKRYRNEAA